MAEFAGYYNQGGAVAPGPQALPDRESLWLTVTANPQDFGAWEQLLRLSEAVDGGLDPRTAPAENIKQCRKAFSEFLKHFPLCFGYWKKYADLAYIMSGNQPSGAQEIFEESVQAMPNCVDLWTAYGSFAVDTKGEDTEAIREIFERGAKGCGMDFVSHAFWDRYIQYEEKRGDSAAVAEILRRVCRIPMYQYARYFEALNALIGAAPVEMIGTAEELEEWRLVAGSGSGAEMAIRETAKERYITVLYPEAMAETNKRWVFEGKIKPAYFNVKPLDEGQIANWNDYLDFEEGEGDVERVKALYERALVPCALYDAFWARYVQWLLRQGSREMEEVRGVYRRATGTFVPAGRPTLKLEWALYEESRGEVERARKLYGEVREAVPGHVEAHVAAASFERRVGEGAVEGALAILRGFLDREETAGAESRAVIQTTLAHTLWRHGDDLGKGRTDYEGATREYPGSRVAHLARIAFETALVVEGHAEGGVERVHEAVKDAVIALKGVAGADHAEFLEQILRKHRSFLLDQPKDTAGRALEVDGLIGSLGPYRRAAAAAAEVAKSAAGSVDGGSVGDGSRGMKRASESVTPVGGNGAVAIEGYKNPRLHAGMNQWGGGGGNGGYGGH